MARADTLAEPGNVDRLGEALARGSATTTDVMAGIDHFELAPLGLEEVRARLGVRLRVTEDD